MNILSHVIIVTALLLTAVTTVHAMCGICREASYRYGPRVLLVALLVTVAALLAGGSFLYEVGTFLVLTLYRLVEQHHRIVAAIIVLLAAPVVWWCPRWRTAG